MKYLLISLLLFPLFGCEYPEPRVRERVKVELVCDKETVAYRKQFILQCINNANPHSDEEPEDWIRLCKQMAEQTYCTERTVIYIQEQYEPSGYWVTVRKEF